MHLWVSLCIIVTKLCACGINICWPPMQLYFFSSCGHFCVSCQCVSVLACICNSNSALLSYMCLWQAKKYGSLVTACPANHMLPTTSIVYTCQPVVRVHYKPNGLLAASAHKLQTETLAPRPLPPQMSRHVPIYPDAADHPIS